jgi:hypothetical protein
VPNDDEPGKGLLAVHLSPDYSAPTPLWSNGDLADTLVPKALLEDLIEWQRDFDAHFHWETGWDADEAKDRWAKVGRVLVEEVREALAGKAELTVDLWPLN